MKLVYETKQLKHADDIRNFVEGKLNVSCSVVVTPSNTIIVTNRMLSSEEINILSEWLSENMDGRLIKTEGGDVS